MALTAKESKSKMYLTEKEEKFQEGLEKEMISSAK